MDPILKATSVLNDNNWLFFKLYKDHNTPNDWKSKLDWHHQTLFNIVKPVVSDNSDIRIVFFGIYGPTAYSEENETYQKKIEPVVNNLVFMRLRFSVQRGKKKQVKSTFLDSLGVNRNLVWDYEIMRTFDVRSGLGQRYASGNSAQTLQFIRYWDAACRYILSIIDMPGNWLSDVDVWGVPHLVNNSLGGWLRPEVRPISCPECQTHMYMATSIFPLQRARARTHYS